MSESIISRARSLPNAADVTLAGFKLWIHKRVRDRESQLEPDFLDVTASCSSFCSEVWVSGPIVITEDVDEWIRITTKIYDELAGQAAITCAENSFSIDLEMTRRGSCSMKVEISPDPLTQSHVFFFEIDQSYLLPFIKQCQRISDNFAPRGPGN